MAIIRRWGGSFLIGTVLLACFLVLLYGQGFCQSEITYLPRNEEVATVSRDYPANTKVLSETPCAAILDLFDDAAKCNYCVSQLRPACPDCCLILTIPRAVRCQKADPARVPPLPDGDPAVDCLNTYEIQPFSVATCGDVACPNFNTDMATCASPNDIPDCQKEGCGRVEPKDSSVLCELNADNSNITCEAKTDDFVLTGCAPAPGIPDISNCPRDFKPKYEGKVDCPASFPLPPPECYAYNLTDPEPCWQTYENDCTDYADEFEKCQKTVFCCQNSTCTTGFSANCNLDRCVERVGFPECDTYTVQDCIDLNQDAQDSVQAEGDSADCFVQIDSNFSYRFVAKSDDHMVILWQLSTTPHPVPETVAPSLTNQVQFYTRVKVYEVSAAGAETLVHSSITHQKNLRNSFSIFCATQIAGTVLRQGRAYIVRLYYFLPHVGTSANTVEIHSMRLILARTRE